MQSVQSQCRGSQVTLRLAWLGLCVSSVPALPAQQVPTWSLVTPEASFPEPFDNLRGARELSDGRLIVLDVGFFVVSLSRGIRAPLGRSGDGPGEYRLPLRLFGLRGDTTAYIDMARPRKLLLIQPSGELRGSLEITGGLNVSDPEAADGRGMIYSQHRRTKGPPISRDSTDIVGWDLATGRRDTVAAVMERKVISSLRSPLRPGPPPPFFTHGQWSVSWDGRVAGVSVEPYQVTLFNPDRTVIAGPVIPTEQFLVTDAHRQAWLEKAMEPIAVLSMASSGSPVSSYRRRTRSDVEPAAWPKYLPPFLPRALSFAPDGMLWVLRTTEDPYLPVFDVIDKTGRLSGRLALPRGRRLLCHGKAGVYLVRVDEDGLQYIEHYRLPNGYRDAASR